MLQDIQVVHSEGVTTLFSPSAKRRAKIPTAAFEIFQSLDGRVQNQDLQKMLLDNQAVKTKQAAASLLEKFTPGYGGFNQWCALLEASNEGGRRFFSSNPVGQEAAKATMLVQRKNVVAAPVVSDEPSQVDEQDDEQDEYSDEQDEYNDELESIEA